MTLDETTYSPGTGAMGFDHPISWVQDYQGGRSFYTGLGHTAATYAEPLYRQHLLGGIRWAAGEVPGDAGATLDRNYQKVVLDDTTLNPMALDIAADGRVFYVQRGGAVKMCNPQTNAATTIGNIPVYSGSEDGLLGIALDPNFATNQWVYLFYSAPSPSEQHVSRFTLVNNQINMPSERILLRVPLQRTNSNHSGGLNGFRPRRQSLHSTRRQHEPISVEQRVCADRRAARPLRLGRAEVVVEHERPARQDPADQA